MVTFSTEIDPRTIPLASQLMTGIVPWQTWQRRIAALQAEIKSNPYWEAFLLERHGLELGFGALKRRLQTMSRVPWPIKTPEEYRLYSFLAVAVRVYANLSPAAQARFAGGIRKCLEKEFGLGPLAFEMTLTAHLMSAGFDVEFHDLESDGGYDFLASRGPSQVEVECKFISADIGRQIHRRRLYDLGGVLFPTSVRRRERIKGVRLVRVGLPGRLTSNKQHQTDLTERIRAVIRDPTTLIDDAVCRVVGEDFPLEDSPFTADRGRHVTMDDIGMYLRRAMNIDHAHTLLNW